MAIIDRVKYDGRPDVFAWKYPSDALSTWTQLIVNQTQCAVLYKGGQALDAFGPGRHTLDTANIPLLCHLINLPFGGQTPFTAEVWFVNLVDNLDVKWGTPSPIQVQDPKYGVFVPVRANGRFGIRIIDPRMFLTRLVGTLSSFTAQDIARYFRGLYVTRIKDAISTYFTEHKISILEINTYLDELSEYMRERITPILAEYGIGLVNFFVNDVSFPDDDPAVVRLRDALAKRAEMDVIGFSYAQERTFDTLEGAATNSGGSAAPVMGAGMGLGMGFGMGAGVGNVFSEMTGALTTSNVEQRICPKCKNAVAPGQKFCGVCGSEMLATSNVGPESVACASCGTAIPNGAKFCPECGKPLKRACRKCGLETEGSHKFCPECGSPLEELR